MPKAVKRSYPPRRTFFARSDAKISSIEGDIDKNYGLPRGSVRIVLPNGKDARGDKRIGQLHADWAK